MVYNKSIVFQKTGKVKNEYGEYVDGFIDVITKKAFICPISGKEFFAAETVNSEVTHKIFISYKKGILPKMRIKFGDRFFSITSIINVKEKNQQMQLMCKELIQ